MTVPAMVEVEIFSVIQLINNLVVLKTKVAYGPSCPRPIHATRSNWVNINRNPNPFEALVGLKREHVLTQKCFVGWWRQSAFKFLNSMGLRRLSLKNLPPIGTIWRGNKDGGSWCGHYKPFRRCSAMWRDNGEPLARRLVLAKLWRQHLTALALSDIHCPYEGLMELVPR